MDKLNMPRDIISSCPTNVETYIPTKKMEREWHLEYNFYFIYELTDSNCNEY